MRGFWGLVVDDSPPFWNIPLIMSVLDTSSWDKSILFFVNGKKIVIDDSKAVDQTLLSFLRSRGMGLTGTKLGCGEGGCGACSVMISRYDHSTEKVEYVRGNEGVGGQERANEGRVGFGPRRLGLMAPIALFLSSIVSS